MIFLLKLLPRCWSETCWRVGWDWKAHDGMFWFQPRHPFYSETRSSNNRRCVCAISLRETGKTISFFVFQNTVGGQTYRLPPLSSSCYYLHFLDASFHVIVCNCPPSRKRPHDWSYPKKNRKNYPGENPDTRIYGRIRMCTYLRRYEATDWHITQLSKHKAEDGHTFIFW